MCMYLELQYDNEPSGSYSTNFTQFGFRRPCEMCEGGTYIRIILYIVLKSLVLHRY